MNTAMRILLTLIVGGLCTANADSLAKMNPAQLRCDFFAEPLGVDSANPRLDWILQANDTSARVVAQSAYRVLAASSPNLLAKNRGDLWDSGKVISDQTFQIFYAGGPLNSDEAVWWKVRIWDESGQVSSWSSPAQWTMGVLKPEDWKAKWITA
jgi:alpha-L-rhamnosidase